MDLIQGSIINETAGNGIGEYPPRHHNLVFGEAAYLAAFLLSFFRNAEDIRYGIRHGRASDGTEACREPEEGLFLMTFPILGTQNSVVRQKMVHKAWFKPLNG